MPRRRDRACWHTFAMPPKPRPAPVRRPWREEGGNRKLLLAAGGAGVVAVALIVASIAFRASGSNGTPATIDGNLSAVAGIPQHGLVLGNPKARVTLTEYVDTSCPICREYALTTFPAISKAYVRTGKVKVEWRGIAFVGPSSPRGQQLVLAAARQNKAWQLGELLYRNQGNERKAWLTDAYARALAAKVPGLNVDELFADASSASVKAEAAKAERQAQADQVPGTPTFFLTSADGKRHLLGTGFAGAAAFRHVLDLALKA